MKNTVTLLFAIILSNISFSQIPNESFENWTAGMPDFWLSSNGIANVQSDSNSFSGYLAVRLQTVADSSGVAGTTFSTRVASSGTYYPLNTNIPPTSVQFWAITNLLNGDMLRVNTTLKKASNIVALINGTCVSANSSTYQFYNFPITYTLPGNLPDSGATWFSFVNGSCVPGAGPVHLGSFVIIDGLSFDNPTGINMVNEDKNIIRIYPNPSDEVFNIYLRPDYFNSAKSIPFEIYNVNGQCVMRDNIHASGTEFKKEIRSDMLEGGIYFIKVVWESKICHAKFIVK